MGREQQMKRRVHRRTADLEVRTGGARVELERRSGEVGYLGCGKSEVGGYGGWMPEPLIIENR